MLIPAACKPTPPSPLSTSLIHKLSPFLPPLFNYLGLQPFLRNLEPPADNPLVHEKALSKAPRTHPPQAPPQSIGGGMLLDHKLGARMDSSTGQTRFSQSLGWLS